MKISRRVYDENTGDNRVEEKVLQINVKPGWKAGTRVTFAKEGDRIPGKIPADIAFVIRYVVSVVSISLNKKNTRYIGH